MKIKIKSLVEKMGGVQRFTFEPLIPTYMINSVDIWSSGGAKISKETIIKGLGKSGVTIPKGFFQKNYKGKKDELSTNK